MQMDGFVCKCVDRDAAFFDFPLFRKRPLDVSDRYSHRLLTGKERECKFCIRKHACTPATLGMVISGSL